MVDCGQIVVVIGLSLCRIGLLVELICRVYGPMVEWLVLGMYGEVWCGRI